MFWQDVHIWIINWYYWINRFLELYALEWNTILMHLSEPYYHHVDAPEWTTMLMPLSEPYYHHVDAPDWTLLPPCWCPWVNYHVDASDWTLVPSCWCLRLDFSTIMLMPLTEPYYHHVDAHDWTTMLMPLTELSCWCPWPPDVYQLASL